MPSLRDEIQQRRPFATLAQEAYLNLVRTSSRLEQLHAHWMKRWGVTPTQYNVLRILRGAHPRALHCSEIGARMVAPLPDVTRLLDRLAARGWIERQRAADDRRVVRVAIAPPGLDLLARLDEPVLDWGERCLGHLGDDGLRQLVELLERVRAAPCPPGTSPPEGTSPAGRSQRSS